MADVVLDSEALSRLASGHPRARALVASLARHVDAQVVVPAVVIAESTTGTARDAPTNAVIKAATVVAADEVTARLAGALRYAAGRGSAVDAIVIAHALRHATSAEPVTVMTCDEDLVRLANGHRHVEVTVVR